jgi:sugar transferase (PEP-CTERM/EpsH1 system associated)
MTVIHIEHVLLSLRPGGLENGVINVINGLDRSRFHSSVCCLKEAGEFASRIEAPGVRVQAMGLRTGNDLTLPLRLAAHFRKTRPDIVHTRNAESFFYGFLGARLAGVAHTVHSEHGRTFSDRRLRFLVQRWMSRFTTSIFAVSDQLKRDLVLHVGIPTDRIEVLYNGVDLARFGAGAGTKPDIVRSELRIGPHEVVVGSVGRLVAVKNYALLLRAVASIDHQGMHVVLVGDGPERAALNALASDLGIAHHVHLLGYRDDVSRVLGAFDIFVLPSLSEGMSNTLLEAMARGLPPVVSGVGGNKELVHDGLNGRVFPSGDSARLGAHLARLGANPAERAALGRSALQGVTESFGIGAMIDRYDNLYSRVARGNVPCR